MMQLWVLLWCPWVARGLAAPRRGLADLVAPARSAEDAAAFYSRAIGGDAEVLSVDPLLVKLPGFATAAECDALLARGGDAWRASTVVRDDDGAASTSYRTSRTAWLDGAAVPPGVAARARAVHELPDAHAEKWQLARYGAGDEYRLHTDTVPAFNDLAPGGRFATLLLYLDDVERGGATAFPEIGVAVTPERGTAIYFRNVREPLAGVFAMDTHPGSRHAGEPVDAGTKHIATRWVHPVPYPDGLS